MSSEIERLNQIISELQNEKTKLDGQYQNVEKLNEKLRELNSKIEALEKEKLVL